MDGGVVQYIKLLLDPAAARQVSDAAGVAGKDIGNRLASGVGQGGAKGGEQFSGGFGAALGKGFDKIRDTMYYYLEKLGVLSHTQGSSAGSQYSNGFQTALNGLATRVLSFYAILRGVRFAEDAVRSFSDFQAELIRTSTTLANFGVRFDDVRGKIENLQVSMSKVVGPTEFYKTFNRILGITGDYDKTMHAVQSTMNLSITSGRDFAMTATAVGKALEGTLTTLQRYGLQLKAGDDVLAHIDAQTGPQIIARMGAFKGTMQEVSTAWEMFRITLGQAITQMGGGTSIINMIITAIKSMTQWVKENTDTIRDVGTALGIVLSGALKLFHYLGMAWVGAQVLADAFTASIASVKAGFEALGGAALESLGAALAMAARLHPAWKSAADGMIAEGHRLQQAAKDDLAAAKTTLQHISDPSDASDDPLGGKIPAAGKLAHNTVESKQVRGKNEDTALTHRIELLGKGLLLQDQQKASADALDKIEAQLNAKLENRHLSLEQEITLQDHLKEVQKAREAPDTALGQEVTTLRDRLTINQNDGEARTRLLAIQTELNTRAAQAKGNALEQYNISKLLVQVNGALAKDLIGPLQRQGTLLHEMAQYPETRNKALADGATLLGQINALLAKGNLTETEEIALLRTRNELNKDQNDDKRVKGLEREATALIALSKNSATAVDAIKQLRAIEVALTSAIDATTDAGERARLQAAKAKIDKVLGDHPLDPKPFFKDITDTFNTQLPQIAQAAATQMSTVFENAFTKIIKGSENVKQAMQNIGKGMAQSLLTEIAAVAKGKVKENLAYSIEEGAHALSDAATGNFAGAAAHATSALKFLASAAEWGILAGASAAGGGSSGGTQGGNVGGKTAATAQPNGPQIIIHVDGIDPKNPRHQELAGQTVQQYAERTGGSLLLTGS